MKRLLRLYPPAWRARYGEEFRALLEDLGSASPRTVASTVLGALDAWAAPQSRRLLRPRPDTPPGGLVTEPASLLFPSPRRTARALLALVPAVVFLVAHASTYLFGWDLPSQLLAPAFTSLPGTIVVLASPLAAVAFLAPSCQIHGGHGLSLNLRLSSGEIVVLLVSMAVAVSLVGFILVANGSAPTRPDMLFGELALSG